MRTSTTSAGRSRFPRTGTVRLRAGERRYTVDRMKSDRRQFLASTVAAAPLFIPSRAFGANDRLAFGLIGAGGRGRYLQQTFLKLGAECVAIAEVYDLNTANAAKNAPDA